MYKWHRPSVGSVCPQQPGGYSVSLLGLGLMGVWVITLILVGWLGNLKLHSDLKKIAKACENIYKPGLNYLSIVLINSEH